MGRKQIVSLTKKMTAGFLAIGMVVAGIAMIPAEADAAVDDQLIYSTQYDIVTFWEDNKTAPVKEGYVFGGWYQEGEQSAKGAQQLALDTDTEQTKWCVPLKETEIDANSDGKVDDAVKGKAFAKFVPAKVLSVKAQNMAGTEADTPKTYMRVISSLDSINYQKVGFDIWLENEIQLFTDADKDGVANEPLETTSVYSGLMVGTDTTKTANEIFGGVSKYLSVWQLSNIRSAKYGAIIYVRPYWCTMDGTKVEGMAKYIHIEDQYLDYISVPVNLQSNALTPAEVAAGKVVVGYNKEQFQVAEVESVYGVDAGRVFAQMNHNVDTVAGTVSFIGNVASPGNVLADGLYANIRFKKTDVNAANSALNFVITEKEFCNWNEQLLDDSVLFVQ